MKCRICGSTKKHNTYNIREMMFGTRDIFKYFLCEDCGCLQIAEISNDLSKYYPSDYYSFSNEKPNTKKTVFGNIFKSLRDHYAVSNENFIGKLLYQRYPSERLRALSLVPLNGKSRILDVGSGAGQVVYSLREIGLKNVLGIDAFLENDLKLENGVSIQKKDIFQIEPEWDLIMFHHSFEHLVKPVETIFHVKKILAPGGTCLIRMPVVPSYAWKKYGTNWVQLDAPRHLHIFSVKAMEQLANSARMELAKIKYDSTILQFWGSEQYAQDVPLVSENSYFKNPKTFLFTPEQVKKFQVKTDDLNRAGSGDQVVFYLKNSVI